MKSGDHWIAVRISNWNLNSRWEQGQFFFGYYDSVLKLVFGWQIRIYFLLGIIFLALCLNVFLSFTSQKRLTHLLFSALCVVIFLSLLLNYLWAIADVSNAFVDVRNMLVPITIVFIGFALPVFFIYEYDFPYKKGAIGFVILVTIALITLGPRTKELSDRTFGALAGNILLLTLWGIVKRREGGIPVLIGMLLSGCIFLLNLRFGIDRLTIFSTALIICYTFILARQFSMNERLKKEASIRSMRLENQLLKRSINPHYLLNSLTSIMVWLKREPSKARELIESLSEEFRIVSQISNLEKIAMRQELELCRMHLKIMSCRKNSNFRLVDRSLDLDEKIPPMIFHTLIENGITHGYEHRTRGTFVLTRTALSDGVMYRLCNDGDAPSAPSPLTAGTGFKYVQARLEESYPAKWSLDFGKGPNGFEVTIMLHDRGKAPR
jgi:hypothetical protein